MVVEEEVNAQAGPSAGCSGSLAVRAHVVPYADA